MSGDHPGRPRALLQVADGVALGALGVAVLLIVVGPFRAAWGAVPIVVTWMHAAFAGAAIAAVRHVAVPRPSARITVRGWTDALRRDPAMTDAAAAFLLTRPIVLAIGLTAVAAFGVPDGAPVSRSALGGLAARWDAQWYAGIAADGYEWQHRFDRQQNFAFFPALPLLERAAGHLTGAFATGLPAERRTERLAWAGALVALASFFAACVLFARLARDTLPPAAAPHAVLLMAAYPFALFYSAGYTEALFLLAALAAWRAFRRDALAAAVAWGLLAGLSRPNGCFLSVPLGLLALGWRDIAAPRMDGRPPAGRVARRLAVAAAPGVGMLIYTAYLYQLTGVWFAWSRVHEAWGRVFGAQGLSIAWSSSTSLVSLIDAQPYTVINALGLVIVAASLRSVWRLSPAWAVFVAINVAVPLMAGGLLSMGRITSTLFPVFLALAAAVPPRFTAPLAAGFALVQGCLAALFFTWRGVY